MPLDIQNLIQSLIGGGQPGGGPPPPGGMPPGMPPPGMNGGGGLPEIPQGGSDEMTQQLSTASSQVARIGAQLMGRGQHDAAIACAKAVKELEKIPQLIHKNTQVGGPPGMGGPGGGMGGPPMMPQMGPPPMPGMS